MKGLRLALIGKTLAHSFSKAYFDAKFEKNGMRDCRYSLIEMPDLNRLRHTVDSCELDGFNVTIPFKTDIIPLLDNIDATAEAIGAVNTVRVIRNGGKTLLFGYNTDAPAFMRTLSPMLNSSDNKALILGTGGAARAVEWALKTLNIDYTFVSRHPELHPNAIGYEQIEKYNFSDFDYNIIINATPVGMFPDNNNTPWTRYDLLSEKTICYDLIYNPSPTRFLSSAASRGASTIDGLKMLHLQADMAFEIFSKIE